MMNFKKASTIAAAGAAVFAFVPPLFASQSPAPIPLAGRMATLAFQLAIIIFAAWVGEKTFKKLGLPAVLGELIAGIIIGPYLFGAIALPGFPDGFFPLSGNFPVSYELYGFATIASIVLLFLVGLETDLDIFLRFSLAGSVIGIGGVVISFIIGDLTAVWFSRMAFGINYGFADPIPLFLGVLSTATSVGISASILSEKRKLDSPEGVTILSAAIIDDVIGIILLAVIIGVIRSGSVKWSRITIITLRAVLVWLGFMLLGIAFSGKISALLKKFKDKNTIAVMSFALALMLAGIFEKSGLAMIIGAYIMGLTLSKTDLAYLIRENLSVFYRFFIPLFFCVMGMLINVRTLFSPHILLFALVYSVLAIAAKIAGCSIPALFLNFNRRGAARIGIGMVPRGEVALIIAGIGLAGGILNQDAFNAAIIMTFITTLITPPIFSAMIERPGPVTRKGVSFKDEKEHVVYHLPNRETAELILSKIFTAFKSEGFYIHLLDIRQQLYSIRKEETFITMHFTPEKITFDCRRRDVAFIHTLFYEVLADLEHTMRQLQSLTDREKIGKKIFSGPISAEPTIRGREKARMAGMFDPRAVSVDLKGQTKDEVLEEMIDLLVESNQLPALKAGGAVQALLDREKDISTGMQEGVAFPHARTDLVDRMVSSIGVSRNGVEFGSLDGKPAQIFITTLIPVSAPEPYLKFMAILSGFLVEEENREKILSCSSNYQLYLIFKKLF